MSVTSERASERNNGEKMTERLGEKRKREKREKRVQSRQNCREYQPISRASVSLFHEARFRVQTITHKIP